MDSNMDNNKASITGGIALRNPHDFDTQVMKKVLDGFDLRDGAVCHAVKEFLTFHENGLRRKEHRQILRNIESGEALDALVQVHRATVLLLAAEFRHSLAQKRFEIASTNLGLKIREFEEVDEDWDLNLHKGLIVRRDRKEEEPSFRKIFEFVKSMAEGRPEVSLPSIRDGHLPESIEDSICLVGDTLKVFLRDLAEFLLETKAEGCGTVLSICEEPEVAKVVAFDQNATGLLRFWAAFTLKHIHGKTKS